MRLTVFQTVRAEIKATTHTAEAAAIQKATASNWKLHPFPVVDWNSSMEIASQRSMMTTMTMLCVCGIIIVANVYFCVDAAPYFHRGPSYAFQSHQKICFIFYIKLSYAFCYGISPPFSPASKSLFLFAFRSEPSLSVSAHSAIVIVTSVLRIHIACWGKKRQNSYELFSCSAITMQPL